MSKIDNSTLRDAFLNNKNAERNEDGTEYGLHTKHFPGDSNVSTPEVKHRLINYLLGNKETNKIKHIDPTHPIIDALDIDWSGYSITIGGEKFEPQTTFELLDLIFRLIQVLFDKHNQDVYDVEWNDNGYNRTDENKLDWGSAIIVDDNIIYDDDSSKKYWKTTTI